LSTDKPGPEFIPDIIETMFAHQLRQMKQYREIYVAGSPAGDPVPHENHWGRINKPTTQAALRENAGYVVEELYEAVNLLKNKPWKQHPRPTDVDEFREEIADVWHFFIQFHIIAGISPTDVFEQYFSKALENERRRADGY